MKKILIATLLALALIPLLLLAQEDRGLVVHEWGTFTTIAGEDGAMLEWRPLNGPSDLPKFVYTTGAERRGVGLRDGVKCANCSHVDCSCGDRCKPDDKGDCHCCKTCGRTFVRMETPVLYFYSDHERKISVKVDFPKGRITEWYPQAREVGAGIDWGTFLVRPDAKPEYLVEKEPSHYYPARETDAAPVQVCGIYGNQSEKFLFYRGVGDFELPIAASLEGDQIRINNRGSEPIKQIVLFENRNGNVSYDIRCAVKGEIVLDRPRIPTHLNSLCKDLHKILTNPHEPGNGLYSREAEAMINTWKETWFEEGLRVFYTVPRKETDAILPIAIEPKPAELVRVLVGRIEILTPEFRGKIRDLASRLGDDAQEVRERAERDLVACGRFADPVLRQILKETEDAEVCVRIKRVLGDK